MCYVKYLFAPQKVVKRLGFKYVGMCCKKSGGLLLCNDRSGAETTGSFSAHTATHSINGSAHETQNFSAGITENKKRGNKHCQQTHLTPPNIHDIVESRLRISQEGAHHLGCGLFLWYPFVVSEEKGETI